MKEKRFLFIFIFFPLLLRANSPAALSEDDFALYNRKSGIELELNEHIDSIQKKLGTPIEKIYLKERSWPGFLFYTLKYENVRLQYREGIDEAYILVATGSDYETKRGLKVGDAVSRVYKLYRKSEISAEGKYGNVDAYYIDFELSLGRTGWKDPSMRLIIRHDGEKITRISLQYDEHSM